MSKAARKSFCHPEHGIPPRGLGGHYHGMDRWFRDTDFGEKEFDVPVSEAFQKALQGRPGVAIDYNVLGGTPHMAGTRIPVFMVLDAIEYYGTLNGALKSYPNLTLEQVKDAVSFASAVLEHPVDYKVESPSR